MIGARGFRRRVVTAPPCRSVDAGDDRAARRRVGECGWRDLFQGSQGRIGPRVLGKGDKERVITVRDDLWAVLSALHGSEELNAKDRGALLPSGRGAAYSTRGVHKLVAQATHAAGINRIDKPVSPHWLRHTHATLAAAGGAPAVVIQASLGHARLEISQRYIHGARGLEETTVDSLPNPT